MSINCTVPTSPNVTLMKISPTSVSISWMQDSQYTYDNFIVSYTYNGSCIINGTNTTDLTIQNNAEDDVLYQYTITDLQEFSDYILTVYAVNRSLPTSSNTVK